MNFATWSLRNPIPAILLFALLGLAGVLGFQQLSIQDLPDLDVPTVRIVLTQPGAAPAQLETEVARKVEDALATLDGLKHLRTAITEGQVQIQAEFELDMHLPDALVDVKDAVDQVRPDLPADLQPAHVSGETVGGQAILTYAVASARMDEQALSWFVDDAIAKALTAVPGVARVERLGGVQREIRVDVDPARLNGLGVTVADVSRALRRTQQDSSGGRGQLGGAEQAMRTVATVTDARQLSTLPVALADGRGVRLDQVATVSDTSAERVQAALLDGQPAVGFNVYRARGHDETRIAAGVTRALAELQARDESLSVAPVSSSVAYTEEQYRGSMQMLYEGALLAVLVVWWFLRDWRATLVAASALPLSILPAFAAMAWLGYSLNTLTLLALAVIVGILVDDAIVEIENIERHRRMGKSVLQATGDAVNEIALAVMATTLTLVVVFVPTTFMSGVPGLLFQQFGWTAVIAVLASLMVARLLTPILAAWMLKPQEAEPQPDSALMHRYLLAVQWCLRHRKTTMAAATAFFVGSMALIPLIPTGLIPAADGNHTAVTLELAPGSTLADTLAVTERVRTALDDVDGIATVFTTAGGGGSNDDGNATGVRQARMTLVFAPRGQRASQEVIENEVRNRLTGVAGARMSVGSGGPGQQLTLILASDNNSALKSAAQAVERELRGLGTLAGVQTTASLERPEIVIRPDASRAAERGVSSEAIGEVVRLSTMGDFDAQLPKLNLDERQIGIRVRMSDAVRGDLDALGRLRVNGRDGPVPLASVADLSLQSGPAQIERYDRRRYVTVSAGLGGMPLGDAVAAAHSLPSVRALPSSVSLIEAGDAEMASELAAGFGLALLTGVLCMFCVLVLLFKDFFQPITILSALPLSLGGAFLALLLARSELDVPSMIGLVMLMGIVAKNSILLVEYAVVGHRSGLPLMEALVEACHKRARPIVMTTVAMIAGMLPIALGLGADASFRQPMAIAVIGGLITSTALSLLVVPVVFTYIDGLERWLMRVFSGRPTGPLAGART